VSGGSAYALPPGSRPKSSLTAPSPRPAEHLAEGSRQEAAVRRLVHRALPPRLRTPRSGVERRACGAHPSTADSAGP